MLSESHKRSLWLFGIGDSDRRQYTVQFLVVKAKSNNTEYSITLSFIVNSMVLTMFHKKTFFKWRRLWFVFGTSSCRLSVDIPAVLTGVYRGFALCVQSCAAIILQSTAASLAVVPKSCTSWLHSDAMPSSRKVLTGCQKPSCSNAHADIARSDPSALQRSISPIKENRLPYPLAYRIKSHL
jgi:hypothetical protein